LTDEAKAEERPRSDEDSHGIMSHVNEDDEKLKKSITKEEGQRDILIIGGVEIFLPSDHLEVSIDVASVTERQPAETMMEEKEQILRPIPTEGDEHSKKILDVFG